MVSKPVTIQPFSCGSQYADWQCSNCDRCTKDYDVGNQVYRCDLQEEIDRASLGDGTVSAETAARMGINEESRGRFLWPCAEVDWTPEWKAEWAYRRTLGYRVRKAIHGFRHRIRKAIADRYRTIRQRILWPIAERQGMDDPDGCWASWCGWAMGYGEKPGPKSGLSCKEGLLSGEGCWCGKFRVEDVAKGA